MDARELIEKRLQEMEIPYEIISHPPVHTMEDCKLPEQLLGGLMPKNLFLRPRRQEEFYLCITRPDAVYKASVVSRQAGASRLGFASEEELLTILHSIPGAANPFALMFEEAKDVTLLMDESLRSEKRLLFHPCDNAFSIALSADDYYEKFLTVVGKEIKWVNMDSCE